MLTSALCVTAAEGWTRFGPKPGGNSKVRIEGTSTIHDWQVESPLVGGFIELGPNFPRSSQGANPGKLDVRAEVFVPVSSLKSVKKDGTPYSTAMDDIMHEKLLKTHHPRIVYRLRELSLKEIVSQEPAKFTVEAVGDLVVAGVTNQITFPAQIQIHPDNHLTITGEVPLKMTSFKIEPPAPKVALGLIKTGDDVKVLFHWEVFPR
ncbi:MAG: YceI family protein [Verrucomicrobiota bacterium]|nr:YceI family protein [Limisphaera sp.]MDW8380544.1 YceI family protein [Verrucomicrobiota bacterium]